MIRRDVTTIDVLAELDLRLNPITYRIENEDGSQHWNADLVRSMTFQELLQYFRSKCLCTYERIGFSNTEREVIYFHSLKGKSVWEINNAMWEYNKAWDTIKQEGEK